MLCAISKVDLPHAQKDEVKRAWFQGGEGYEACFQPWF